MLSLSVPIVDNQAIVYSLRNASHVACCFHSLLISLSASNEIGLICNERFLFGRRAVYNRCNERHLVMRLGGTCSSLLQSFIWSLKHIRRLLAPRPKFSCCHVFVLRVGNGALDLIEVELRLLMLLIKQLTSILGFLLLFRAAWICLFEFETELLSVFIPVWQVLFLLSTDWQRFFVANLTFSNCIYYIICSNQFGHSLYALWFIVAALKV